MVLHLGRAAHDGKTAGRDDGGRGVTDRAGARAVSHDALPKGGAVHAEMIDAVDRVARAGDPPLDAPNAKGPVGGVGGV
eukprot:6393752-Pyramimonas_sp.AAC.1